jgi:hypothetical protein
MAARTTGSSSGKTVTFSSYLLGPGSLMLV